MLAKVLDILCAAVLRGAEEVLAVRRERGVEINYKEGNELVTLADRQSDRAIRAIFESRLRALIPGISLELEESGASGALTPQRAGADPLDGTEHYASGGSWYCVQAHYMEDGIPLVGAIVQPEAYLPLTESPECLGRLVYAIKGRGAFHQLTTFRAGTFMLGQKRAVQAYRFPKTRSFPACVPFSVKMTPEDWNRAMLVHKSGLISSSTGLGGAAANVLMVVFGGHQVYANIGAGNDLDLIPPQVIAEEAGLTVWGAERRSPIWHVRTQPVVVAPSERIADLFCVPRDFKPRISSWRPRAA